MAKAKPRVELETTTKGYWYVEFYIGNGIYSCRCICGTNRKMRAIDLRNGPLISCGCKAHEIRAAQLAKQLERTLVVENCEPLYA